MKNLSLIENLVSSFSCASLCVSVSESQHYGVVVIPAATTLSNLHYLLDLSPALTTDLDLSPVLTCTSVLY